MRVPALGFVLCVVSASIATAAAGSPSPRIEPRELLLPQPVTALAADRSRVAFAFCGQLIGVWKPGASTITELNGFPAGSTDCPASPALRQPPVGSVTGVALVGSNLAWILSTGGNLVENMLGLASVADPGSAALVVQTSHIRDDPTGAQNDRLGAVLGHGSLLVFASRLECGDPGAQACAAGTTSPTLVSQSLWLLHPGSATLDCVGRNGPCSLLASADTSLVPVSADGNVVAVREAGALTVLDATGRTVRSFATRAPRDGVVLTDGTVVTAAAGRLAERSLASGKLLRSWPLPGGSSAELLDAGRGLVAYLADGSLHLLRLRDGHSRAVTAADDAGFGARGLFYTSSRRVVFVPWRALPLKPQR